MSAPLLEIRKLTLRFGGLTAVSEVDLQVQEGEVAAVIGPNGAGKTSLFNAVTGIYEPTSGEVLLDGKDLRDPLTRGHIIRQGLAGLALGCMCLLAAANVDTMWAAVVKQQNPLEFSVVQAGRDAWTFLQAEPRIEARMGRFFVVSSDGKQPLGSAPTRELAVTRRQQVAAWLDQGVPADLGAADKQMVERVTENTRSAKRLRIVVFLLGTALGVAAAYAVWQRSRRTPTLVARRGIARTFQNIRLFHNMTVTENVVVAMDRHIRHVVPWWHSTRRGAVLFAGTLLLLLAILALSSRRLAPADAGAVPIVALALLLMTAIAGLTALARRQAFTPAARTLEAVARAEALELLAFVGLQARAGDLSRNLPYGDQRRLEIARALATRPRLLLLDEPAAGMNPSETVALMALIRKIRDRGVTVLLIEHHMRVVMGISDRITVLVHGKRIAEGTPEQIRNDPKVIEAYLGTDED